jgi:hypothetical protein
LVQDRGILTVAKVLAGSIDDLNGERAREMRQLAAGLDELGVIGFPEVDIVSDFESGAVSIAQSNGIAGIDSNTVMFGWSDKPERQAAMLRVVEQVAKLEKSAVIGRIVPRAWNDQRRSIHVWWGGLKQNGDMLVLFAHLLSLNPEWRNARIVINSVATNEMTYERNRSLLMQLTTAARIDAEINVVRKPEDTTVQEIIHERSADADVVLLGLRGNSPGEESTYARRMQTLMDGLSSVLFVRNAGEFRGQLLGHTIEEQPSRSV